MIGLRRNAAQGDGPTARFLYAILRQLDTRSVDWNEVAEEVECTNGHAARMRYSRFKQHMEGTNDQPQAARVSQNRRQDNKKTTQKKKKQSRRGVKKSTSMEKDVNRKDEKSDDGPTSFPQDSLKLDVKVEPCENDSDLQVREEGIDDGLDTGIATSTQETFNAPDDTEGVDMSDLQRYYQDTFQEMEKILGPYDGQSTDLFR